LVAAGIAIGAMLLGGCGFVQSTQDAEKVVARHFQELATNGVDVAMTDYGDAFFKKTTKQEWRKALSNLGQKLGTYQSDTITSWRVFKNAGTTGSGTTVTLQFQVTYSKHKATENFTLFKGITDSDYKIVGHQINSTGLLTE
jgi:hypothetical protein